MARPPNSGPTERELLLLKVLWRRGPSSVRDIRKAFPEEPKPAHTSLLTNLQGMLDKGYVERDTQNRGHVYRAVLLRESVERNAVKDIMNRVFDGSAIRLVATALTSGNTSSEELERLQMLLDEKAKRG